MLTPTCLAVPAVWLKKNGRRASLSSPGQHPFYPPPSLFVVFSAPHLCLAVLVRVAVVCPFGVPSWIPVVVVVASSLLGSAICLLSVPRLLRSPAGVWGLPRLLRIWLRRRRWRRRRRRGVRLLVLFHRASASVILRFRSGPPSGCCSLRCLLRPSPRASRQSSPALTRRSLRPRLVVVRYFSRPAALRSVTLCLPPCCRQQESTMDVQQFLLSELNTDTTKRAAICVRVMRKWIFDANKQNGPILRYDLVLADKEGNAIYAEIPQRHIEAKAGLLEMDEVYNISRFVIRRSKPTYRPFDAAFMIEFTAYTLVSPAEEPKEAFPSMIYNIKLFSEIETLAPGPPNYVDTIGAIVSVKPLSSKRIRGNDAPSQIREVTIQDLKGENMLLTLWGDKAANFSVDDVYNPAAPAPIVVLFVGCIPKVISTNASEVQRLPAPVPLQHMMLRELNAINPFLFPEEGRKCTARVTFIPNDNSWWYVSSEKCKVGTRDNSDQFVCSRCGWTTTVPRYRMTFEAEDATDTGTFFSFDETARQIVRKPCKSLINPLNIGGFPKELEAVINKEFVFSVTLTKDSLRDEELKKYLVHTVQIVELLAPALALPPPQPQPQQHSNHPQSSAVALTSPEIPEHAESDTQPVAASPSPATAPATTPPPQTDASDTPTKDSSGQRTDARRKLQLTESSSEMYEENPHIPAAAKSTIIDSVTKDVPTDTSPKRQKVSQTKLGNQSASSTKHGSRGGASVQRTK